MIADKIMEYKKQKDAQVVSIGKHVDNAFNRQFVLPDKESGSKIYASNVGGCVRKLAYSELDFPSEGKEIDQRARNIFFTGDLWEIVVVELALLAGIKVIECLDEQIKHKVNCYGYELTVMPDGQVITDKKRTLEVKSMNSFGFKDFEKGYVSDEYLAQVNLGMEAQGNDETVLVAVDKQSGFISEKLIKRDVRILTEAKTNCLVAKRATKENLPPRKYQPNDKGFLVWQCRYCPYWKTCYPKAVELKNGGIKANE